jgi:hypothetical protein
MQDLLNTQGLKVTLDGGGGGRCKPADPVTLLLHDWGCFSPGCGVQGFDARHWLVLQQPARFNASVRSWLDQAQVPKASGAS